MSQWKSKAYQLVGSGNARWPATLKGDGNWELHHSWSQGDMVGYTLSNRQISLPDVDENEYIETKNYFYAPTTFQFGGHSYVVYAYVSKSEGGAISFKGKGRWSGNPGGLGKDLGGIKLMQVHFGGVAGYCMRNEDIAKILNKNFIGLIYKLNNGFIEVDWSKTITELKKVIKVKKIIREELKSILKK